MASCAVPQLNFGDSELVCRQSLWSAGDRWAWYHPDMMEGNGWRPCGD
jgi:hypothetical protein